MAPGAFLSPPRGYHHLRKVEDAASASRPGPFGRLQNSLGRFDTHLDQALQLTVRCCANSEW